MCETDGNLDGKVAIVTGGGTGVGYEAAKNLARRGAKVIIASRNETKLKLARDKLEAETGNKDITYRPIDLGSLKSVRSFVSETVLAEERLDTRILVNNAGAVGLPDRLTDDGINLTMQVNYFGTFLLTYLLIPLLRRSAPSRIINASAGSMYIGSIDFDHWNDVGRYSFIESLSNSKLAIALFNVELSKRLADVTANSYDPFVVPDTDILNQIPDGIKDVADFFIRLIGQPKEDVGAQIAYLAAAPELKNVTGNHYKFCVNWFNHWLASDDEVRRQLWDASKELVRINGEEDWE